MNNEKIINTITQEMAEYVDANGFSSIAILLAYLYWVSEIGGNFENWNPDSLKILEEYGGTNCVGATIYFLEKFSNDDLFKNGFKLLPMASISSRLFEGVSSVEVPHQHMAMILVDFVNQEEYLVDPGLGLVKMIPVSSEKSIETHIAERIYTVSTSEEMTKLTIKKPSGKEIVSNLVFVDPDFNPENLIQKPLLRATTRFKIDTFDCDGFKLSSLKINCLYESITFFVDGVQSRYYLFSELEALSQDKNFGKLLSELGKSEDDFFEMIDPIIKNNHELVSIWFEPIRAEYLRLHPEKSMEYKK